MTSARRAIFGIALVVIAIALLLTSRRRSAVTSAAADLAMFNKSFREVILRMDNAGVVALWADDGVSLLPDMAPIAGKANISGFMDKVMANLVGYRVTKEEIEWKDVRMAGDWASEWGIVHQEVQPPGEKPMIEVYGRIALVLHHESGGWKIAQEVWQSAPKP